MAYWLPQEGPQALAAICPADETFYGGTRGGGKGQSYQALIATPFGFSKMGDLKVGSMLCNPDGTIAKVLQVHELGERDLYRVTFDDGATTEVTDDHLWPYRRTHYKLKADRRDAAGEFCKWVIGTTTTLMQYLAKGNKIRVPLTSPIAYTKSWRYPLNIDPYILGLLLGDGYMSSKGVTLLTEDVEIASALCDVGLTLVPSSTTDNLIALRASNGSELYAELKRGGLLDKVANNKFIPKQFLYASVANRWSIIQGLMDTDGYADSRGHIQYTTVSKQLALDVQQLVRGLGGKATLTDKIGQYRNADGRIIECQRVYMLYIQHPAKEHMFQLERKRSRCVDREWNGGNGDLTHKMVSIEKTGRDKARCIRVDHPNGLYLTDDFIVTHNTDCAIGRHVHGAEEYGRAWNGLFIRRKYKDLNEVRRRWDELIAQGLPAKRIGGETQVNYIRFENGATVILASVLHPGTLTDFQGQQFVEITLDEAPSIPFISTAVDMLKGCLRSPHGIPCHMFLTGNPGGVGASSIKAMYIDPKPPGVVNELDIKTRDGRVLTTTRVFIKSTLYDNKILMKNDKGYERGLLSIKDDRLRKAWMEGSWDVTIGQAFDLYDPHIIDPIWPVPEYAPLYMTFDWGFGAPFSVGWWWVDGANRVYRFAEWYGYQGPGMPNIGLRLPDQDIVQGIKAREITLGINKREITRLAGPDCFNKKPDYKGGGQGASTATEFAAEGIPIRAGDPSRALKIRQFRNRLRVPANYDREILDTWPMMVIYNTCRNFLRTVPSLVVDELTGEDLEDHQEDHCYDGAALLCMARPHGMDDEDFAHHVRQQERCAAKKVLDSASVSALNEWEETERSIRDGGFDRSIIPFY